MEARGGAPPAPLSERWASGIWEVVQPSDVPSVAQLDQDHLLISEGDTGGHVLPSKWHVREDAHWTIKFIVEVFAWIQWLAWIGWTFLLNMLISRWPSDVGKNYLRDVERASVEWRYSLSPRKYKPGEWREENIRIPIPGSVDGSALAATLMRPGLEGDEPLSVIVQRTPYGRHGIVPSLRIHVERGFACLAVDSRGRFSSDGSFFPIRDEQKDAHIVVEWALSQKWCSGKIGVCGASYNGFCAYSALASKHRQNIAAVIPIVSGSRMFSVLMRSGGAMNLEMAVRWLWLVIVRGPGQVSGAWQQFLTVFNFFGKSEHHEFASCYHCYPLVEADERHLGGQKMSIWRDGFHNMSESNEYWKDKDYLCDLSHHCPPIHILAGWNDFFLDQSMQDYTTAKSTSPHACITIGDFAHWQLAKWVPMTLRLETHFFQEHLMNDSDRSKRRTRAEIQLMGTNEWIVLKDFPPKTVPRKFHLCDTGALHEDSTRVSAKAWQSYVYDPLEPTPCVGGASFHPWNNGRRTQEKIEARAGRDLLLFTSTPATKDSLFIGYSYVDLVVQSELKHFDLVARLCVVDRKNVSRNICEGLSRIGIYQPDATEFCKPFKIHDDGSMSVRVALSPCGFRLCAGESLRLHICSAAYPRWMPNRGVTNPAYCTARAALSNTIQILVGQGSSSIELPFTPRQQADL